MKANVIEIQLLLSGYAEFTRRLQSSTSAISGLLSSASVFLGARALNGMVKDATAADVALVQLQQALANTGQYSSDAEAELTGLAKALQSLTGVQDETTLSVERMLLSQGATVEQVKKLTPLVLDLSANMGTDAVNAARLLGSALDGQNVGLGKLNIQAKSFDELTDKLTIAVGGQAAAIFRAKGPMGQFAVVFGETQKAIGNLLKDPVEKFFEGLVTQVQRLGTQLDSWKEKYPSFFNSFSNVAEAAGKLIGSAPGAGLLGIVAGLVAMQGAIYLLTPALNLLRSGFLLIVGTNFITAFSQMQRMTEMFNIASLSGVKLMGEFGTKAQFAAGAIGILGAAFAGWSLGTVINNLEIFGVKISDRVTRQILIAMEAWIRFRQMFANGEELAKLNADLVANLQTQDQMLLRQKPSKPGITNKDLANENGEAEAAAVRAWAIKKSASNVEIAKAEYAIDLQLWQYEFDHKEMGYDEFQKKRIAGIEEIERLQLESIEKQKEAILALYDLEKNKPSRLQDKAKIADYESQLEALDDSAKVTVKQNTLAKNDVRMESNPNSFSQQWSDSILAIQNQIGTFAQQTARAMTSVIGGAISSIADGLTGLIEGTKTWGQALLSIGQGIVHSIIQAFSQMVAEWIVSHILMQGVSATFSAVRMALRQTETAHSIANTGLEVGVHTAGEGTKTGSTIFGTVARGAARLGETVFHGIQVGIRVAAHIAGELAMTAVAIIQAGIRIGKIILETLYHLVLAAIKGASAVADIPYAGPILAIAAMAAIVAAGMALMGGFAEGGMVRGPGGPTDDKVPIWASAGEGVITAKAVQHYGGESFINRLNNLQMPAGNGPGAAYAQGGMIGSESFTPNFSSANVNVTSAPAEVSVLVLDDENRLRRRLEEDWAKQIIIKHVNSNRRELGLPT